MDGLVSGPFLVFDHGIDGFNLVSSACNFVREEHRRFESERKDTLDEHNSIAIN